MQNKKIRNDLWGLSALILQLSDDDLQEHEHQLHQGMQTPVEETCLIKISRILRHTRSKLIPIEKRLYQERKKQQDLGQKKTTTPA